MRTRMRLLLLAMLAMGLLVSVCGADVLAAREPGTAAAGNWQEDFRRCLIRKPFDGGTVTISTTDGALEIDVLWNDDTRLDAFKAPEIRAEIDQKQIELRPRKSDVGDKVLAYELGSFATAAPLLSNGRSFSLAFADHPERDLRLSIGNGRKAMGFLRKCHDYWEKWRQRHP
jgi:hypothetical protein